MMMNIDGEYDSHDDERIVFGNNHSNTITEHDMRVAPQKRRGSNRLHCVQGRDAHQQMLGAGTSAQANSLPYPIVFPSSQSSPGSAIPFPQTSSWHLCSDETCSSPWLLCCPGLPICAARAADPSIIISSSPDARTRVRWWYDDRWPSAARAAHTWLHIHHQSGCFHHHTWTLCQQLMQSITQSIHHS